MKLFNILAVFLSVMFMTVHGYGQQDTCVVLTGSPLNPDSYRTVKRILEQYLDCYVKEVSLQSDKMTTIATADLSNVKFMYCAGGWYFHFNPSTDAAENIRQAVANGMGYFGTCGGALIAIDSTPAPRENQFRLFPGFQPYGSGKSMRDYDMNLTHPIIENSSVADSFSIKESIHYNGGGSDFCPSVPGLVNWVIAKDVLRDTPALTGTMYGKGRVFLSVAHPERSYIPATWKFVRLAAEWCLGRSDPVNNQVPVIEANIPDSGETGMELTFSAAGSDDPEGYPIGFIWNFGDGSDLEYRPVEKHIYTDPGTFELTLTVTDGKDEKNFTQTITIKAPQLEE